MRNYGAPEAIVTDSGGVFYSKRAIAIYEALAFVKSGSTPGRAGKIIERRTPGECGVLSRLAIGHHSLPCGPSERIAWLLFLKLPHSAARKNPQRKPDMLQLPLPDFDENRKAGLIII